MQDNKRVIITMELTTEQIAIAKTAMETMAQQLGADSLIGAECVDTAEYMANPANWTISERL
jgi:hypothetical protein